MGFFSKLFGGKPKDERARKLAGEKPKDDNAQRSEYDTGFVRAYGSEEDARKALALLKERAESYPNTRVELRVNRDYESQAKRGYRYFPWLVIVFVKFNEGFLDPDHVARLLDGAPQAGEGAARQGAGLRTDIDSTEFLDAFDTARADVGKRASAKASLPDIATYDCVCGHEIRLPVKQVSHVDGVLMKCSLCGDNRLIPPSIFDGIRGGQLPDGWEKRILPPL